MKKTKIGTVAAIFCILFCESIFASDYSTDIHGFISQGYMKTVRNNYIADSENGTFQFNEMGINFGNEPIERLYIGIQFFARDLGNLENDEIKVDYAFADFHITDMVGIRAGRIKNPMGIYSECRDVDMLRTCILLPLSVYDENLRDSQSYIQGISVYGNIIMKNWGTVDYQALIGSNNISPDSPTALFLGDDLVEATKVELETIYSYALHYIAPKRIFQISGTAFFTNNIEFEGVTRPFPLLTSIGINSGTPIVSAMNNVEVYTGSFVCTFDKTTFSYERKYTRVRNLVRYLPGSDFKLFSPIDQLGFYYMIAYNLTDWINISIYYDTHYRDSNNRNGHNPIQGNKNYNYWTKDWAFSCKFYFNSNWLFKLETHYIDGAGYLLSTYNKDQMNRYWWLHAVKISYHF